MRSGRRATIFFAVAILAMPGLLAAQTDRALDAEISTARKKVPGTLKLRLTTAHAAVRSDAPFSVEFEIDSTFLEILDGELDLTFLDDQRTVIHQRTSAMVIPSGQKAFRLLLPAMAAERNPAGFTVHAQFETVKQTFDLGAHDLIVPAKGQRVFVIAAAGLSESSITFLARHLQFDSFRPANPRGALSRRPALLTLPVELDLHDLPADATGLYSFDMLVLAGEHFSALSPRQLDTTAAWIASGGGAVIVPSGTLAPAHTQFLSQLAGRDAEAPVFRTDPLGRLPARKLSDKRGLIACRYGFGRALVLAAMPTFERDGALGGIDKLRWRRAICFLWNVRPEQMDSIVNSGTWERWKNPEPSSIQEMRSQPDDEALQPAEFSQANALRAMLFPEAVRVVPFSVVATILTLFLLAIAPGDYLVLGWLRRRRYTWLLFPTLSLLFTIVTVGVAAHYTGRIDHRDALVIVDLDETGRPLRTSRIEHVMTAASRPVANDVQNGFFAMTAVQPNGDVAPKVASPPSTAPTFRTTVTGGRRVNDDESDEPQPKIPLDYEGAFPAKFTVSRLSRQWTPAMHRVTHGGSEFKPPVLDWTALDAIDHGSAAGQRQIVERIRRAIPDCECAFVSARGHAVFQTWSAEGTGSRFQYWPSILAALSRRQDGGLFWILSQISPNGAGNLEDLSILDASGFGAWALHLAVREGHDLVVYRRVWRKNRRVELQ